MPMLKPQWTYQTKGTLLLPNLECNTCGGVLPGGRRLSNLFTRRCRCDDGAETAIMAPAYLYLPTADPGLFYTWNPKPFQVVELFCPNPLPELPESFKRIRAADKWAAERQARREIRPHLRSNPHCHQRHSSSLGTVSVEPALTFYVEDARKRLQHVRDTTTTPEPLHPFLDTLIDATDDVVYKQPRLRTRKPAAISQRAVPRTPVDDRAQADALGPTRQGALYSTPPPSPLPSPPAPMTPAQVPSASHVPSSRVSLESTPRYPVAEQHIGPGGSPGIPPPESAPRITTHRPSHRDTTRPLRGILRNTPRDTERSDPPQLHTPDATPRSQHSALDGPYSPFERRNPHIVAIATLGSSTRTVQPSNSGLRASPQAADFQSRSPWVWVAAGQMPAEPAARPSSPPGASASLQSQTPLVYPYPRPSWPDTASHFSPLLRSHGPSSQPPSRINEENDPSTPIYVRYESTDEPFSIFAPEALTASPFCVFGQQFWSVSQGLAWAKAYRYMHSREDSHEDRIIARARQQEILVLSPSDEDFVSETFRLYQETPHTPSWAMYEMACANIVTKAKVAGPDARARELLLHEMDARDIYWDVNSMICGRGREKPDGQNAYGIILMNIREGLRHRAGSPLDDNRNPLLDLDVLYGL